MCPHTHTQTTKFKAAWCLRRALRQNAPVVAFNARRIRIILISRILSAAVCFVLGILLFIIAGAFRKGWRRLCRHTTACPQSQIIMLMEHF